MWARTRCLLLGTRPWRSLWGLLIAGACSLLLLAATIPFYEWAVAHETLTLAVVVVLGGVAATGAVRAGCGLLAAIGIVLAFASAISLRTLGGVAGLTPLHVVLWMAVEPVLAVTGVAGVAAFSAGSVFRHEGST